MLGVETWVVGGVDTHAEGGFAMGTHEQPRTGGVCQNVKDRKRQTTLKTQHRGTVIRPLGGTQTLDIECELDYMLRAYVRSARVSCSRILIVLLGMYAACLFHG